MSRHTFDVLAWARMTMFEQMGNIGSEVSRALAAKRQGDEKSATAALYRGLDLIDATAEAWALKRSARTRELLRARELFVQSVTTDIEDKTLETYFLQFAIVARRDK